jgi:acetyl esterase
VALHPQALAFLESSLPAGGRRIYELDAPAARAAVAPREGLIAAGPPLEEITELAIAVRGGATIPGRRYRPAGAHGTIAWLHGGGWVFDGLEGADAMCRALAQASGATVIDVDYRVAPEHPFPVPLDDCFDALGWIAAHADPGPLVLGGDSAGGNLSAVCALRARDHGGPALLAQVLIYPITDCDFTRPSYTGHGENPLLLLGAREMVWFFDQYVAADGRANPEVSPLRAGDLSGLPPAIVVIAEYDPLRDEGIEYAKALRDAGVAVTLHTFDDMPHGFWSQIGAIDAAEQAVQTVGAALREMIENAA